LNWLMCLCVCLLLLLPYQTRGQGFSGFAESKIFVYTKGADGQDPAALAWATLFTKYEYRPTSIQYTISFRAEAISDNETQEASRLDLADRGLRRPPLALRDFWLRIPLASAVDLQLGRFELGWGRTDGYSPADAFLPRDLTDPFADEKLPLWAARLTGQRGPWRMEAVLCPLTTPWRLPALGSRNAPMTTDNFPAGSILNEEENSPPQDGFAALRLQTTTASDWDLGIWVRGGVRPAPLLDFRLDQAKLSSGHLVIPVDRHYAREQALGVELARMVDAWIFRAELAAMFSSDPDLGDALIGTLSAERSFGDNTLLITLAGNAISPPVDSALLFDRAILPALITTWNRAEEWGDWKLVWTCGLDHGDGLLKAELGYNLNDFWKLILGGDLPYGSRQGPLGALQDAGRLYFALRRSW
jgi:hypothetical protein